MLAILPSEAAYLLSVYHRTKLARNASQNGHSVEKLRRTGCLAFGPFDQQLVLQGLDRCAALKLEGPNVSLGVAKSDVYSTITHEDAVSRQPALLRQSGQPVLPHNSAGGTDRQVHRPLRLRA